MKKKLVVASIILTLIGAVAEVTAVYLREQKNKGFIESGE